MVHYQDVDPQIDNRRIMVIRGVVAVVLLALISALLYATWRGAFSDDYSVVARVDDAGGALVAGSDVKMRGVIVGRVASIDAGDEFVEIELSLFGRHDIPGDVQARVLPATVFGTTFVDLVPGQGTDDVLRAGQVIDQEAGAQTRELQDTLNSTDALLGAINPAELSSTLSSVATVLDGRGDALGQSLERVDSYLALIDPYMDDLPDDLRLATQAALMLEALAPDLFDATEDGLVTARTIVDLDDDLTVLMDTSEDLTVQARAFLARHGDAIGDVTTQMATVIDAMFDQRAFLAPGWDNFTAFGRTAQGALSGLPGLTVDGKLIIDVPDTYDASQCPRYGSVSGECSPTASRTGTSTTSSPGPVDPDVVQQIQSILSALDDDPDGFAAVFLGPYLEGAR